jgi:hypothetical protein
MKERGIYMANEKRALLCVLLLSGCGLRLEQRPTTTSDETQSGWERDERDDKDRWAVKEVKGAEYRWQVKHSGE